jgi:ABC-type multidrug transport system fused ATPase/permease subunit
MASFEAVQGLPQAAQLLEANLQAARRLFQIADSKPAVSDPPNPLSRPVSADLAIKNLSFAYETSPQNTQRDTKETLKTPSCDVVPFVVKNVLSEITFNLPPGHKIAIVGPSGAGKTTLANLLLRFWDYTEGQIHLDGHDLRDYAQTDARRMFSVVGQTTYLFNASLRENLLLARPWATQADLETACRQSELHDFIASLPEGYDTLVGERGLSLSGGERQRLAIARALLKNAPILLLDEPTANLDPATEAKIITTLHRLLSESTSVSLRVSEPQSVPESDSKSVLWITHRLIGLDQMDEILVLDGGKITERGTHAELLAQDGLYKTMWDLQNRTLLT